jgi:hypothetical protein
MVYRHTSIYRIVGYYPKKSFQRWFAGFIIAVHMLRWARGQFSTDDTSSDDDAGKICFQNSSVASSLFITASANSRSNRQRQRASRSRVVTGSKIPITLVFLEQVYFQQTILDFIP